MAWVAASAPAWTLPLAKVSWGIEEDAPPLPLLPPNMPKTPPIAPAI
jgi:hypothetical protein